MANRNKSDTVRTIPPLIALVYRSGKGCQQYAFETVDDLAAWASRHPYKNEQLRVMPVKDRQFLGDRWMPAAEAADFVRMARGQPSYPSQDEVDCDESPVLERCRSGGVIRWARIGLQLGQFAPLKPNGYEVVHILLRCRSLRWQQQFRQKSPFAVPDRTGAGRPACSIVPISGALSRLEAMGYTEADLDASNPYTQWARGE